MKCCIVVPVYKSILKKEEIASFKRLLEVLCDYDIFLVCPESLDNKVYFKIQQMFPLSKVKLAPFKESYFWSIDGYNKLLLSTSFYKRFNDYEYMLVYQLDCWVFRNELEYWCSLNYDYIGAPWFEGMINATKKSPFVGVGNGGFSLRKIKSHIKALYSFAYITPIKELWGGFLKELTLKGLLKFSVKVTITNNTFFLFNNHSHRKYSFHEDTFWGMIASQRFSWFNVPDELTAGKFSIETNVIHVYELNKNRLPFGCHAWERIEPDFWNMFINIDDRNVS